jgi:membrane protease subunit (stomatin/prohibitin family)
MAIIDVIKFEGQQGLLVWKWEAQNNKKRGEEIRLGSQLIVAPAQEAIFVRGGEIVDVFGPGTHTLSTNNLPILSKIIGLAFGSDSPFNAEVYFVNKSVLLDNKFGLLPFNLLEPNFKIPVPITARGSFALRVEDGSSLLKQLVGNLSNFESQSIAQHFRGVLTENIKTAIAHISRDENLSPFELEVIVSEVSTAVRAILEQSLSEYGLDLKLFSIEGISIVDDDPKVKKLLDEYQRLMSEDVEERMRLKRRAENLEVYKVERTFDTTEKAAENLGGGVDGGTGSILGTMVGMGMVNPIAQSMGNMMSNVNQNVSSQEDGNSKIIELLKQLGELKSIGVLTEEEFSAKKQELLSKLK